MLMSSTSTATSGTPGPASAHESPSAPQVVKDHAGAAASTAKDEAISVVHSATEHARTVLGSAGEEFRQQGRSQAERLGKSLDQASKEFDRMAQECDTTTPAGRTVRTLADATGQLAQRLERGGPEGLMADASRFARQRPAVFLTLSAAVGFAVARLARSTDTHAVTEALQSSGSNGQRADSAQQAPAAGPAGGSDTATQGEGAGIDFVGEVASTPTGAATVPVPPQPAPAAPRQGAPNSGGGLR